jgi:hypothetical protein
VCFYDFFFVVCYLISSGVFGSQISAYKEKNNEEDQLGGMEPVKAQSDTFLL